MLLNGFGKTYYSQGGEDIILQGLLGNKKDGFYVDVGAYHPKHYSNTYLLYKQGWRGINIDPNPASIFLFNLSRSRDTNINYGITERVSKNTYFVFNHQSCNTFSEQQKNQILKKNFIKLVETKQISCAPLKTILEKYAPKKQIDLLNIDVEGLNLEVLRSFDWNEFPPKVICVEDDQFNFRSQNFDSDIFVFLKARSYALYAKTGLSCIYVLDSLA